jgi:predicted DsbA family dithiol-disulfide isomerase
VCVIEVYADIWCPFAHVGLRSTVRWRRELARDDVVLRVRAWPLELVNGAPLDPTSTANHVDDLRTWVAPDLFVDFDPDHFPHTSLPALALAAAAYRRDDRTGEAISLALCDALFEQGRDISRPDVIAGVASEHGIATPDAADHAAVRTDWHQGEQRGVKGSPYFFCGELDTFCPSLDISTDGKGQLHIRRSTEALDAFLATCFKV